MLRASYRIFPKYFNISYVIKKLVYYACIYPFLKYSQAIWDNAAKVHINRIVTLKQAIRLVYRIKRLDHVAPIAYKSSVLILPKLYDMILSSLFFRYYIMHYNATLFTSQGII